MSIRQPRLLPIHGIDAYKLFEELMRNMPGEPTEETAMNWLEHVNCITIFPTTPFYLRTHCKKWSRNQRVKDSVNRMMAETARLDMLNRTTSRNDTSNDAQFPVECPTEILPRPAIQAMPPPPTTALNSDAEEKVPQIAGLTAADRASSLNERPINTRKPGQRKADVNKRGDGSFWLILSFHVIVTDKARIIQSIKS
jgi:hypothetical protein